ncbi:MAG: carboxypeptidase regulatory-like domain-containing protein [Acidobacteriota bacterium]
MKCAAYCSGEFQKGPDFPRNERAVSQEAIKENTGFFSRRPSMRAWRVILGLVLLAGSTTGSLLAQAGATGTILGTVTDSTGAVVPNVKVTVTNTSTNVPFVTRTSSAGDYLAPNLIPGSYSVTAEIQGFQRSITTGLTLTVDQNLRANVILKPGEVTQTLSVTAQAVNLDTDSTALSQLMGQHQVEQLPLNGRNFMQLLTLTAGTVTVGGEQGTMRQGEGNAVSVNGGRPEGNNYTLDGLINTDQALVTPAVILSQDAIQEFKIESGTYSAEYGFSASQINIVSKAGTNQLHGAIFEFDRNDAFEAKPFATAASYATGVPTQNPILRQNQFGFVLDGPVYIPKIYNGHNRTFFMANYEGWRINNGERVQSAMPNPNLLTGNFNGELAIGGGSLPLYGTPECAALISKNSDCMPVDPTTGKAFPNNQIPSITNRLAQVAIKNGYFETPTETNQPEGAINFVKNIGLPLTTNQQTYRIDQSLGKLGSLFGRGTYSTYQNSALNTSTLNYGLLTQYEKQKNWEVSHTISIGNSMVNNFRFGYLDAQAPQGAPAPPADAVTALAETGTFTKFAALQQTWPDVGFSKFSSTGGPVNAYTGSDNPSWEFADSFTWVHGKHNLGFGFDYRHWHLVRNLDDDFYGDWGFSAQTIQNNSTNCPNAPVSVNGGAPRSLCGTGNSFADFLLGYYNNVGGFFPGPLSPTNQAGNPQDHVFGYFGPYAEDSWKATQKLTVDLGLRWDYRAAAYEAHNHFFWLDTTNSQGGLCFADPQLKTDGVAPGAGYNGGPILRYCGSVPHPGLKTPFAPRFGLDYRLNDKTVVRGGYGIFFDSYEGREIDDSADIYPYSIRLSENPTSNSALPKYGNQMFPTYGSLGAFPVSTLSFIAVIESENPLDPYVQSWTASAERQLSSNTTLEVNYIGTHSVHLLDRRNIAQPNDLPAADVPFCQANPTDTTHLCPASSRLPYPNFTNFYIDSDFHGYAHYNAMNINLRHTARNLAVTAIYTWATSKDDKSAAAGVGATGSGYQGFMDNHRPQLDYGLSDFDVNQRFVSSYIYNLPVGRGQKLAGGINRAANLAIGGWQLSGITTFQAGFPFGIGASDVDGLNNTPSQRASLVAGCNPSANVTQPFQRINMSCFSQPGAGTYGDTLRNFLRQPGINNWDMGLTKSFVFTERAHFDLRFDTFNTFNHHQYVVGVGGLATGGSGGGSAIDNTLGDPLQGLITSAALSREIQLSGKFSF